MQKKISQLYYFIDEYNYAELSNLTKADELHFTSEATRIAGKLYYEAYENLVNKFK